jgi:hypothetical protein
MSLVGSFDTYFNQETMKHIMKLAAVALAAGSIAHAAPVNLGDLIGRNGSITHGDKIFADFHFGSALFSPNDATVNVSSDASGTYYLTIQGPFVSTGAAADINFNYTVATTSGQPLIIAIDQAFVLSAAGTGGTILIGETVRSGSFSGPTIAQSSLVHFTGNANTPAISDLEDPVAEPLTGDQLVIDPGVAKAWVTKDIFFMANQGGLVGPTTIIQSFHQTSAPENGATVVLLGLTLSGLGLIRRRFNA